MTVAEMAQYRQRYLERWRRWQAELSWSRGPMATWKPVMTEQQRVAHEQYVVEHKLPF